MNGQSLDMEDIMRSTVLFRVLLVVVVVIATRPCLANVKNDFHETNGGNICNYTAQVSRGGLGGGGVGVSEKNSSGMLLGERKFSGGNGGKGGGGGGNGKGGGNGGGSGKGGHEGRKRRGGGGSGGGGGGGNGQGHGGGGGGHGWGGGSGSGGGGGGGGGSGEGWGRDRASRNSERSYQYKNV